MYELCNESQRFSPFVRLRKKDQLIENMRKPKEVCYVSLSVYLGANDIHLKTLENEIVMQGGAFRACFCAKRRVHVVFYRISSVSM